MSEKAIKRNTLYMSGICRPTRINVCFTSSNYSIPFGAIVQSLHFNIN